MKKIFFLSIVTFIAVMVQAQTWSFGGGTMYFDNSTTQWDNTKMMLVIGNECWSEVVEMQQTSQENLWSAALPAHWNGPSYMAVINDASAWSNGIWGTASLQNAAHYSTAYEGGLVSYASDEYIFVPQSADDGCVITLYRKGEEPQPEPEPNRLENGFYLITNLLNWDVANVADSMLFALNGESETEYKLTTDLPEDLQIKVVKVVDDAIDTWYPDGFGTQYTVDAAHAGENKDIFFQQTYNNEWAAFGGYFWIGANPEPEPEPNRLEDGFYLITSALNWDIANVADSMLFALNGDSQTEYKLTTDLPENLQIKVIKVADDTIAAWYPDGFGTQYTIDAAHAGENKDIFFQQTYNNEWAAFGGYFWIGANPEPEPEPEPEYHWFVKGDFDDWAGQAFDSVSESEANTVYATVSLLAAKEYVFKLQGHDTWYGNSGMMTRANHSGWTFGSDNTGNCALITTIAGNYIFALDTTTMSLSVQYPYNPKQATLYDTPVKDQNTDIMLQAFYWAHVGNTGEEYTAFGDVKWNALNAEAAEIAANFDLVWLAPSQETADYTGYLPINYSKQGQVSGNTEGHSPWGSAQDLRNLIDNLHQGGAKVVADIVLNHSSASHPDEYTGPNSNWCTWGTFDFGQYGQFNPDYTWICKGDEMFYSKKTVPGNDCGNNDNTDLEEDEMKVSYKGGEAWWAESEFNCMYSRDWAHKKKEVREMSRAFLTWMRDSIGYDGFRYDFMKGIHGSHLYDYNCASAPYFSVAELFDGDIDKQLGYLQDANYRTYVFDFPGKFTIYDAAIREYKLQNLKNNGYTLIYGPYKKYAVTFIDNHDSFHEEGKSLNYHANTIDDRQAHQALAYLLSMPGVPCVFYPYWHNYKAICQALIQARRAVGVHSESAIVNDWAGSGAQGDNYYTALIQGTNGQLFLKLGYDCNPTDAPMVQAPAGKRWQCAWADRNDAGVWYTVDDDQPTNAGGAQNQVQSTKVLKEGVVLIQHDEKVFTVQGHSVQ